MSFGKILPQGKSFEAFLLDQAPADLAYYWPAISANCLTSAPNGASAGNLPDSNELVSVAQTDRRAVLHPLGETGGDKLATARLLGIGKTTLYPKRPRSVAAN